MSVTFSNSSLWHPGSAKEANPSSPDMVATTHKEDAVPERAVVLKYEAGGSILVPSSVF